MYEVTVNYKFETQSTKCDKRDQNDKTDIHPHSLSIPPPKSNQNTK